MRTPMLRIGYAQSASDEGFFPRRETPPSLREATLSHKGRGEESERHYSPFHPHALSRSCICGGAGAITCTGSLFFEIGIPISRECRCSRGSPKRGPLP